SQRPARWPGAVGGLKADYSLRADLEALLIGCRSTDVPPDLPKLSEQRSSSTTGAQGRKSETVPLSPNRRRRASTSNRRGPGRSAPPPVRRRLAGRAAGKHP